MGFSAAGLATLAAGAIGAAKGSGAANKAAGQQVAAQQQGINYLQNIYGQTQGNLQPYIGGGQGALSSLLGFYGLPGGNPGGANAAFQQFTGTPSYQFPLAQGNLALNRQLASAGLSNSGAALKDAIAYNQGYASQGLGGYLSGLGGIANAGQNAAGTLGQIGASNAANVANQYTGIGNAQAAGTIGGYNATTQGLGQILGGIGAASGSPYQTGLFGSPTGFSGSYLGQGINGLSSLIGGGSSSYPGLNPNLTQIGGGGVNFGIPSGVLSL